MVSSLRSPVNLQMSFSPSDSVLFAPLFGDERVAEVFSDTGFVRAALQVEGALGRVQGRLGVIPQGAGERIAEVANQLEPDYARLQAGVEKAGVPVAALVEQLREEVGEEAATYVHWGATTQDIMDTALLLQVRAALALMEPELEALVMALARLADRHRNTLMVGRTHGQQALPITFGLKVANWLAPLLRHRERLAQLKPRLFVVQFGGAAGTLAALDRDGMAVREALAQELGLGLSPSPWHTQRDGLAELAGWLSLVSGSLAKMAQDVILMAQHEVGEVRESDDTARGGSSTMPQKRNPITGELIIAAARHNASLLNSMHQALVQEHERATHGWQMEWLALPQMFALSASALNKSLFLARNLVVDEARMRHNVEASRGAMLAEAILFALSPMDRAQAKQLVRECALRAQEEGRHLVDVVRERVGKEYDVAWGGLREEDYLGAAEAFIEAVLERVNPNTTYP